MQRSPWLQRGIALDDLYRDAVMIVCCKAARHGLDPAAIPAACPWTWSQIIDDDDFWPEPAAARTSP